MSEDFKRGERGAKMRLKPLRSCVVGCRMGCVHAMAMATLEDYDLVALCDLKEEVARRAAVQVGCPKVYTDYTRMLAEIQPDVVTIATPTSSHAELTFQAIEAGVRGIYCEKPMATNLADARRMVRL